MMNIIRNNLTVWKIFILMAVMQTGCKNKCTNEFQMMDFMVEVDTGERKIFLTEAGNTSQGWQLNVDSSLIAVTRYNSNGSIMAKVFDKDFKLLKIEWYNTDGRYANTIYLPRSGTYGFEYSAGMKLDSSLIYNSIVIPEQYRKKKIISISNDFIPIQSVFPAVNSKYDLRYDIPNNMVYIDLDSTFTGESVQLTYSVLIGNELINFDSPTTVQWTDE